MSIFQNQFNWKNHYVLSHAKKLSQDNNVWLLIGSIPVLEGYKTVRNRSVILSRTVRFVIIMTKYTCST